FADQEDVMLPANSLTLASSNPTAATINSNGQVLGLAEGNGVISVSRNGIQAVTAFNVGIPTEAIEQAILVLGLGKYPETLALATQVGTRQLKVDLAGQIDLTKAEQGTRYYVGNSHVVSVSADGLVTAKNAGLTTITVINGGSEALIPVRVATPIQGSAMIGQAGGAVQGVDGSIVTIGPGVLSENVTVSIAPIAKEHLPLETPDYLPFLTAFELELGDDDLSQPAQLAIPVSPDVPVGAEVQFFRLEQIPDGNGNLRPIWLLVETGIVDHDGFARTASPPLPGFKSRGIYYGAYLDQAYRQAQLGLLQAQSLGGSLSGAMVAVGLIGTYTNIISSLLSLPQGFHSVETVSISRTGQPIVTRQNVQIEPGVTTTIEVSIPLNNGLDISGDNPIIRNLKLEIGENGAELILTGDRFNDLDNTFVKFRSPNNTIQTAALISLSPTQIRLAVPQTVTLGLADISVVSEGMIPTLSPTRTGQQRRTLESNAVRLEGDLPSYALVGKTGFIGDRENPTGYTGDIAFIKTEAISQQNGQDLIASVSLSNLDQNSFRVDSIVATSDLTRAYIPRVDGFISVIDTQALQEIDLNPHTNTIEPINLRDKVPNARPLLAVTDYNSHYLYITDQRQALVYVVDIRPQSQTYHELLKTIPVNAPIGINRLALNSDGTRLYGTAPAGQWEYSGYGSFGYPEGSIFVIDLDPSSPTWHQQINSIVTGRDTYGIIATQDPKTMLFTNRGSKAEGFGILKEDRVVSYLPMRLGYIDDYFDVNNAAEIAFLPAGTLENQAEDYAFVSAHNFYNKLLIDRNPYFNPYDPIISPISYNAYINYPVAGMNIGIIKDPLGKQGQPQLVAATRPIPWNTVFDLDLSSDGKYLFAPTPFSEGLFVYDVQEIINTLRTANPSQLEETPINEINRAIDFKADYIALDRDGNPYVPNPRFGPKFGVPNGSQNGPIGVRGVPFGITIQSNDWLKLDAPLFESTSDSTPEFTWKYSNGVRPEDVKEVKLYVSVFPKGEGLLPDDRPAGIAPAILNRYSDINPNRILTATWDKAANSWTWSDDSLETSDNDSLELPTNRTLTAGQTYYWAVEATRNTGHKLTKTGEFKTAPIELNTPFNGVTIITHGFQPGFSSRDDGRGGIPPGDITWAYQMAEEIVRSAGGGEVRKYNPQTGLWDLRTTIPKTDPEVKGNSLVLISDWYKESDIDDSGFSEAAADAIFASLVQLNDQEGDKVFNSPLHLIGHSRGTIVTSEIIQRLGTYRPDIKNIHLTTLDVHDFRQDNLNVLGFKWADFQEPDVTVWENVNFADNYYQDLAENNLAGLSSSTPNGRSLLNTNLDIYLNGKVGFQKDDALGQFNGIAIRTALAALRGAVRRGLPGAVISGLIQAVKEAVNAETRSPVVGPHSRVWRWYAGTTNLSLTGFDFEIDNAGNR
ncbi:MAG: Ig-like domain-containing protein, partial [Microcystis panniformis]